MTTGWPCARLFFFFKIKSQAYKNIGSRRRKMQSVLFYRFAGGIDFILFPLAPDQARLFTGIFHYPVANIPGQSGRLTDLHSDLPSSAAARSCIKHKQFLAQRPDSNAEEEGLEIPCCFTGPQWGDGDDTGLLCSTSVHLADPPVPHSQLLSS